MNYTPQITELNKYVKVKLAPSSIEGVGVFALRDIPKGQKLYADMVPKIYNLPHKEFGNLFPTVRTELLKHFPLIVRGSAFAYPTTRISSYLNHSDTPNYDAVNDIVLCDIKSGEEVTEDYRKIDGAEEVFDFLNVV